MATHLQFKVPMKTNSNIKSKVTDFAGQLLMVCAIQGLLFAGILSSVFSPPEEEMRAPSSTNFAVGDSEQLEGSLKYIEDKVLADKLALPLAKLGPKKEVIAHPKDTTAIKK